jgi:hypothetical protein
LFGWSPPALSADTALKRRVDAVMPRSGVRLVIFFAAVVALLNVGAVLPRRLDLMAVGAASLAAGGWCAVNFLAVPSRALSGHGGGVACPGWVRVR